MKPQYTVTDGILFMNPYGKDGPWLPITVLNDRTIAVIEDTIKEVAQEQAATKKVKNEYMGNQ